jgi:signal transduction histidine kinase
MEEEEITHRLELMVEERTRQLEETLDKLLHQDKMASLGKLSAAVVHEINNPVAGVLNLTILMKRIIEEGEIQGQMTEQFHQYLELMETETRRISRIISNLLAFSRQSVMEFRQFDLNALIDMTLLLNANLIKIHGVRVEKSLNSMIPVITGSEDQLQQVFMNFISNAVESLAGPGGGTLHIKTDPGPDKGSVTIRIQDNGIGIPEENIPRLFEPFFTTKKKGKGVGLGLSVVYGIIKEHGGTIRVESEVGKGTVFTILLPVRITPDVGVKTVAKTA